MMWKIEKKFRYQDLMEQVMEELINPKTGHIVYHYYKGEDIGQERRRIYQAVRYHCTPPAGTKYTFATYRNGEGEKAVGIGIMAIAKRKNSQSSDG